MISHFFTTTLRYFLKQKVYSSINLLGLSMGLAIVIMIGLWLKDEISFDNFHTNKSALWQVYENQTYDKGEVFTFSATPGRLAETLKKDFPEVIETVRTTWGDRLLFQQGDKNIFETGMYADQQLFSIFTFQVVEGDARNPLPDNNSIAISEKLAHKFFGDASPIGKTFVIDKHYDVRVTAVFADIPENSTLHFSFVLPFSKYLSENNWLENWGNNGIQTYLQLQPGADVVALASRIKGVVKKHNEGSVVDLLINPMDKWHLYRYDKGVQVDGKIVMVRIFTVVALFILVIACINFMNMATAKATLRMKEVGIRKASGAQRSSIIIQFIGESVLVSFAALLVSLLIVTVMIPFFNQVTEKHLSLPLTDPWFVVTLIVITLFTGCLAGSYPALYLSGFRPSEVLKGKLTSSGGNYMLRKGLVVFQFFLSIILIICSVMTSRQIDFIRNKDMGFDRENILSFGTPGSITKNYDAFRNELVSLPGVVSTGRSTTQPFSIGSSTGGIDWDGKPKDVSVLFQIAKCDYTFIPTAGMKFVSGRNFSQQNGADTSNFIVTEEAARLMNMDQPLGQRLRWDGKEGQIIGVLRNFNAWNLHYGMQPVIINLAPAETFITFIKIQGNSTAIVAAIGKVYQKYENNFPFEFNFIDDQVNKMYKSEDSVAKMANVFTAMAIIISCLGLFALASFTAERRAKEIGIRKVLGATVPGLISSLCRDFLMLVILAILLGAPLAWYIMQRFLGQYAFHTEMDGMVIILSAILLLFIALITVAWQAGKTAMVNPATSLRSE